MGVLFRDKGYQIQCGEALLRRRLYSGEGSAHAQFFKTLGLESQLPTKDKTQENCGAGWAVCHHYSMRAAWTTGVWDPQSREERLGWRHFLPTPMQWDFREQWTVPKEEGPAQHKLCPPVPETAYFLGQDFIWAKEVGWSSKSPAQTAPPINRVYWRSSV